MYIFHNYLNLKKYPYGEFKTTDEVSTSCHQMALLSCDVICLHVPRARCQQRCKKGVKIESLPKRQPHEALLKERFSLSRRQSHEILLKETLNKQFLEELCRFNSFHTSDVMTAFITLIA